jgi:CRISPR-associated protein Cas2
MMVLVSYDVSMSENGQKRLRRVARACKDFGQRVQFSVFECNVDPAQWTMLRQRLIDEIFPKQTVSAFIFWGRTGKKGWNMSEPKKSLISKAR